MGIGGCVAWWLTRRHYIALLHAEADLKNAAYNSTLLLMNDLDAHDAQITVQENIINHGLTASANKSEFIDRRAERAREMYKEGLSRRTIEEIIFGYTGGGAYEFVKEALRDVVLPDVAPDNVTSDTIFEQGDNG